MVYYNLYAYMAGLRGLNSLFDSQVIRHSTNFYKYFLMAQNLQQNILGKYMYIQQWYAKSSQIIILHPASSSLRRYQGRQPAQNYETGTLAQICILM